MGINLRSLVNKDPVGEKMNKYEHWLADELDSETLVRIEVDRLLQLYLCTPLFKWRRRTPVQWRSYPTHHAPIQESILEDPEWVGAMLAFVRKAVYIVSDI